MSGKKSKLLRRKAEGLLISCLRWFYKKVKQNPNFHLEELSG